MKMKIGWSRRDVSSTEPVNLPGQYHARISMGILDPITISVLVIEDDKDAVIFISGDFVSAENILDEIREKIAAKNGKVPTDKVIYSTTHTHCSPAYAKEDYQTNVPHDGIEVYPSYKYREFLTDSISDAVVEAYENRTEGSIAYGYGYAVTSHSRRTTYFDDLSLRPDKGGSNLFEPNGHAKMYGNTNDDMFAGYEGGTDPFVNLMYTFDIKGTLTGAIINVPCPSQNSEGEHMQTASFWNEVRNALRKKYGDIGILPQCAAAGDLAPRTLHYKAAENRRFALKYGTEPLEPRALAQREIYIRHDICERICDAFHEVLAWAKKDMITDAPIEHTVKTILLEEYPITKEEYEYSKTQVERIVQEGYKNTGNINLDFHDNTISAKARSAFGIIVERYEMQQQSAKTKMELHVVRIGDVAFATNPFELYIDFQHRIQARSPFTQTFIVQLAAQPDGYAKPFYLATERAVANRGYSAIMTSCQVSAEGGQTLVEETVKELKDLYEKES